MARTARRRLFVQLFRDFSISAALLACLLAVLSLQTLNAAAANRFAMQQGAFAGGPTGLWVPTATQEWGFANDADSPDVSFGARRHNPDANGARREPADVRPAAAPRSDATHLAFATTQPSVGRVGVAVPRTAAREAGDRRIALFVAGAIFSAMSIFTLALWRTVFPVEAPRPGARDRRRS